MHVVLATVNKDGFITLSKEELQKMLDEAYEKGNSEGYGRGYIEGKNSVPVTYPTYPYVYYETDTPIERFTITC